MTEDKPFGISKWAVLSAWAKVRDNKGAAGVDEMTIEAFERKLKNNLPVPELPEHVIGVVYSAAGAKGDDPQARWRRATAGYPDRGSFR
jgi:hypothetical protein